MKSGDRGATLTELIVAMGLFAMAIAALVAINQMAFQGKGGAMAQTAMANNASTASRMFAKATASASYIESPGVNDPPPPATAVTLWDNVTPDPPNNLGPLDGTQPRIVHYLCVWTDTSLNKTTGDKLLLYQNTQDANPPFSTAGVICGNNPPPTNPPLQPPILVAGGMPGMTITPNFTRPSNNILKISYTINYTPPNSGAPLPPITQSTQVTLQGALN